MSSSITIRRLLLCMLFVGGAIAVSRLPLPGFYDSTAWMLLLSLTCLGVAIGAPFGKWMKGAMGAIVGGGAAVVAIMIFLIPLLAFTWGGR